MFSKAFVVASFSTYRDILPVVMLLYNMGGSRLRFVTELNGLGSRHLGINELLAVTEICRSICIGEVCTLRLPG